MEKIKTEEGHIIYYTDNDEIVIHQIFVKDELRKQGVGKELLGKLPKGKWVVYSSTDPEREVFGKFLVSIGFLKTNEANNYGDKWIYEECSNNINGTERGKCIPSPKRKIQPRVRGRK